VQQAVLVAQLLTLLAVANGTPVIAAKLLGWVMPVLVTGGAGYIGSHVALALLEGGEAVVVRRLEPEQARFVLGR
jgi:hypothetical protein